MAGKIDPGPSVEPAEIDMRIVRSGPGVALHIPAWIVRRRRLRAGLRVRVPTAALKVVEG